MRRPWMTGAARKCVEALARHRSSKVLALPAMERLLLRMAREILEN